MQRPRDPISALALSAVFLLWAAGTAAAIDLTAEEKRKLHESITALNLTEPPHEWVPEVGGKVPDDVKLYRIPSTLKIVQVIRYSYAVKADDVVLADPMTREIVEVIGKDDAKR